MKAASTEEPAEFRRNLAAVSATSLLTDLSSEMVLHLVPLLMWGPWGVGVWLVGLVEGVAGSLTSLLRWWSGRRSDRLRRRKGLAVAGYAVSAAGKLVLPFATSWIPLAAGRWTDRVGKGLRTAPRDALLADSTPPHRRGLAFGVHRSVDTLGAVLGLGGAWLVLRSLGGGFDRTAFATVAAVACVPALLAVPVLAFGIRERVGRADGGKDGPVPETPGNAPGLGLGAAADSRPPLGRAFLGLIVAAALFDLADSSDAFLVLRAAERGAAVPTILLMLLASNLVYAATAGPAGAASDLLGRRGFLAAGWILFAAVYGALAVGTSAPAIGGAIVAYGLYQGLTQGALRALVVDLVPRERRGEAFGILHAFLGFLDLPASLLAGLLWEAFGAGAPFAWSAVLASGAVVVLFAVVPGCRNGPTPERGSRSR